jgi:hypothetical protein
MSKEIFTSRSATSKDIGDIINLYNTAYQGTYPDPMFSNYGLLKSEIEAKNKKIYVSINIETNEVVACIEFNYDPDNLIAKAGSAVVSVSAQGNNLTKVLIIKNTNGLDLLYITTRTVHKVAQHLTTKIGFKILGVFPNAHKTTHYETHILAGLYFQNALTKRHKDFEQHPRIKPVFDVVKKECDLSEQKENTHWNEKVIDGEVPILEIINAVEFVKARYKKRKDFHDIDLGFFPFHGPNAMISSPDGSIEVFVSINQIDKHCVITGVKIDRVISFTKLFLKVSNMLRDLGVRYIEMIVRANRLNIIDKVIKAKFIPCGYVPAFQLENGVRYDYAVFSRSFEVLDFNNIEIVGVGEKLLKEYVSTWSEISLGKTFFSGSRNV